MIGSLIATVVPIKEHEINAVSIWQWFISIPNNDNKYKWSNYLFLDAIMVIRVRNLSVRLFSQPNWSCNSLNILESFQ
jgi:hypothetical protein